MQGHDPPRSAGVGEEGTKGARKGESKEARERRRESTTERVQDGGMETEGERKREGESDIQKAHILSLPLPSGTL